MMNNKGLTVIELLVTITVIAIISAIAVPSFNKWLKRYQIESDTKTIYGFIQEARSRAFSQKMDLTVYVAGTTTSLKDTSGTVLAFINTKTSYKNSTITVSKRGVISSGGSVLPSAVSGLKPQYNCIVVSDLRARLGYSNNGSACDAK